LPLTLPEAISFSYQASFRVQQAQAVKKWLASLVKTEKKKLHQVAYVFVSDQTLLEINQAHLNHDTYTDIITFDYSTPKKIEAEIYISIDRVRENAKIHKTTARHELIRVLAHGLLHCCGYKDKSPKEQAMMRQKESFYIEKLVL
jgi:probable rRNA maturation factor